jgi:hypothetical protein
MDATISATTAVLKRWTALSPASRWALYIGLFAGVCLMKLYMQLLNEHMVRAD